jgi:transcriptional regulator with XRE-family HTH domain
LCSSTSLVRPEREPGELRLHALDHRGDAGLPVAAHERIDVSGVLRPGARDERAALLGVDLVPGGDVAVDQFGRIVCVGHDPIIDSPAHRVDYPRGNRSATTARAIVLSMATAVRPVGDLFREWRQRRRMSQMDLALDAEISTRHLSFLETGRSHPSRDMVLRLAEQLEVPLRERNALLLAAGFAPAFQERSLQDPALAGARQAVDLVLAGHDPYPALAVDRHWQLLAANAAVSSLLTGIAPALMQPPVNVLRLSLHPDGLAPRIVNLPEWRAHLIARLRRQVDVTADPQLADLLRELRDYPAPTSSAAPSADAHAHDTDASYGGVVVPLKLVTSGGTLSLFSTTTVFGTPVDITLAELALETFFPADADTAAQLHALAAARR